MAHEPGELLRSFWEAAGGTAIVGGGVGRLVKWLATRKNESEATKADPCADVQAKAARLEREVERICAELEQAQADLKEEHAARNRWQERAERLESWAASILYWCSVVYRVMLVGQPDYPKYPTMPKFGPYGPTPPPKDEGDPETP